MSAVQEIHTTISQLPELDRISLLQWIQNEDATLREEAENGAQELDAGQGMSLDHARRVTSRWTSR